MLTSKANNLVFLKKIFKNKKKIEIPIFFYFKKKDYYISKKKILKKIEIFLNKFDLIVRSSAINEDGFNKTLAGYYESINLNKNDKKNLQSKIEEYLKQFKCKNDEIIVQKKITKVDKAGVIFTRDINNNSPYYLINYDNSGLTHLITSGSKNLKKKQLVLYKYQKNFKKFKKLIKICKILENKTNNERLDIEFGIKNNIIYLFQVRFLPQKNNLVFKNQTPQIFNEVIRNICKKINKINVKNINILGKKTLFSNMSDWNPAEMIGEKPNPLALSLYKEVITDEIWRKQRANYGYKNVFPNILLFSFAGSPYIDLRTDLNSFIPKNLDDKVSELILEKYISLLKNNTFLHDKIEFDLVETCYSLCSKKRLGQLFNKKITNIYLAELKKLTTDLINNNYIEIERNKIQKFESQLDNLKKKKLSPIQKIFFHINNLKNFGTLPFAGIARLAFISQRILLDLKLLKIITVHEFNKFYSSLDLINSKISKDFIKVQEKKLTKFLFLNYYGHIRPSTYDINSLSYKENYNKYFQIKNYTKKKFEKKTPIKFKKNKELNFIFNKNFKISFLKFIRFAKETIEGREYAKFVFSRGIDEIFNNLLKLGKEINIKRKDLAFLDIKNILNFYSKLEARKLKTSLTEEIENNKREFEILKLIKLPDVIKSDKDIYCFEDSFSKINFVTTQSVIGEVADVELNTNKNLKGKIVLIKNADPGYDYIFSYKIKGLITMYGGSNSHMAIRCLESGIPAAIGVGRLKFEEMLNSKKVVIDCYKKKLFKINL